MNMFHSLIRLVLSGIYQTIYIYSFIEIAIYTQIENFMKIPIVSQITEYYNPTEPILKQYMFIEDGNVILVCKIQDPKEVDKTLRLMEPESYDIIIRNDFQKGRNPINNKIIYNNINEITQEYKVSQSHLLSFVVKHGNDYIEIEMTTKKYNYMVVGNHINKHLIKYFLRKLGYTDFSCNYLVEVISNDVHIFHLMPSDELIINENSLSLWNN